MGVGVRWERKAAQGQLPGGETLEKGLPSPSRNWHPCAPSRAGEGPCSGCPGRRRRVEEAVGERTFFQQQPQKCKGWSQGPSCVFRPQIDERVAPSQPLHPPPPARAPLGLAQTEFRGRGPGDRKAAKREEGRGVREGRRLSLRYKKAVGAALSLHSLESGSEPAVSRCQGAQKGRED